MLKLFNQLWNKHPFLLFLILHFTVWSVLPMFRAGAPMDSMEAVWWGKYCLWGTNKHPPLSGFPAYAYYLLLGGSLKSIYLLSQTAVLVGFIYLYRLAKCFLSVEKAVLSVMLLEGVIFYGYVSPEYNVNVLSLAIWPATAYYFYKAMTENKLSFWLATGLCCALNILNKYVSGLQLLGIALVLISTPQGRASLKTYKPYLTLLFFVALVTPHFYWLAQKNFFVLEYFSSRTISNESWGNWAWLTHFVYPLKFFASMLLYMAGTLVVFFTVFKLPSRTELSLFQKRFLFFLGVFPLLFVVVYSFISGSYVKSMWGFPILYMTGILLFSHFDVTITPKLFKKTQKGVYILMTLFALIYTAVLVLTVSPKYRLDGATFAKTYTQKWHQETERPLQYVVGDVWLSSIIVLKSEDKPAPVIWGVPRRNPWIDEADFKRAGALIVTENPIDYASFTQDYADKVTKPEEVSLEFRNAFGRKKVKKIYYGYYRGSEHD